MEMYRKHKSKRENSASVLSKESGSVCSNGAGCVHTCAHSGFDFGKIVSPYQFPSLLPVFYTSLYFQFRIDSSKFHHSCSGCQ